MLEAGAGRKRALWSLYQLGGMYSVRGLYPGSPGRFPAASLMRDGSRKGKRSPDRAAKRSASSVIGVTRHPGVLAAEGQHNSYGVGHKTQLVQVRRGRRSRLNSPPAAMNNQCCTRLTS